jgi:hypothetical protein
MFIYAPFLTRAALIYNSQKNLKKQKKMLDIKLFIN